MPLSHVELICYKNLFTRSKFDFCCVQLFMSLHSTHPCTLTASLACLFVFWILNIYISCCCKMFLRLPLPLCLRKISGFFGFWFLHWQFDIPYALRYDEYKHCEYDLHFLRHVVCISFLQICINYIYEIGAISTKFTKWEAKFWKITI